MSITLVWHEYGFHFDRLPKEGRLYVASIIFLYLAQPEDTRATLESLLDGVDRWVAIASDKVRVCLRTIETANLDRTSLLDIASALLANSR